MIITVKTLGGEVFQVPCDMPMDLEISYLKRMIHEAEPTYTPFCQQLFARGFEHRDLDPLMESEYLLLLHPRRFKVDFVDETAMYGFCRDFTLDVQEILPDSEHWEHTEALAEESFGHALPGQRVLCGTPEMIPSRRDPVKMIRSLVRGGDGGWVRSVRLQFADASAAAF